MTYIDREKLKAMAVARMASALANAAPAPAPQPPATPLPPNEATPPRRTRKPRTPHSVPAPQPLPLHTGSALHEHLLGPRAQATVMNSKVCYRYRISRPRDYSPERPIHFVSVFVGEDWDYSQDKKREVWEYIGLIRPPGPFMWGRKSKLSASDPRVILFDEFYAGVRANGDAPPGISVLAYQ